MNPDAPRILTRSKTLGARSSPAVQLPVSKRQTRSRAATTRASEKSGVITSGRARGRFTAGRLATTRPDGRIRCRKSGTSPASDPEPSFWDRIQKYKYNPTPPTPRSPPPPKAIHAGMKRKRGRVILISSSSTSSLTDLEDEPNKNPVPNQSSRLPAQPAAQTEEEASKEDVTLPTFVSKPVDGHEPDQSANEPMSDTGSPSKRVHFDQKDTIQPISPPINNAQPQIGRSASSAASTSIQDHAEELHEATGTSSVVTPAPGSNSLSAVAPIGTPLTTVPLRTSIPAPIHPPPQTSATLAEIPANGNSQKSSSPTTESIKSSYQREPQWIQALREERKYTQNEITAIIVLVRMLLRRGTIKQLSEACKTKPRGENDAQTHLQQARLKLVKSTNFNVSLLRPRFSSVTSFAPLPIQNATRDRKAAHNVQLLHLSGGLPGIVPVQPNQGRELSQNLPQRPLTEFDEWSCFARRASSTSKPPSLVSPDSSPPPERRISWR